MKNYISGILLAFICFITPIYAQDTTAPSLTVNHLPYSPVHAAKLINDMLYLSGEDLAQMTYGTYEASTSGEILHIQNHSILYTSDTYAIKVDGIKKQLTHPTKTIDQTLYLPVSVLELIHYPYTLSSEQKSLDITTLLPYSTATDQPASHTLFPTSYKQFDEALSPAASQEVYSTLISQAQSHNQYISSMNTTYKTNCLAEIDEMIRSPLHSNLKTIVHFRQLDCHSGVPILSSFTTLPITYKVQESQLKLTIGTTPVKSPLFWATYNLSQTDPISIDLNKSLDAMIMRSIYEYYRDLYDLKDDLHTSPIINIKMGRSNQISYLVYLDDATLQTQYELVIYRMTSAHTVQYYVDLKAI